MPAEVERLAEKFKGHPGVKEPFALAHWVIAHRERAKAARAAHREKQREKAAEGG